ncbi:MAG: aminotransferase class V-fold PLP-dependent enzyme [Planctomycetales bacterium]|nr:aminotransferase class V-fold PLP-dependent enzyme [Planctomycetales bacterium]NIM08494.1 aminotransferase class V-fold PLP-dependent enzyme [Planctomycetales bacterium]NIN07971.1 aminotransferase class V-fold PLP-dependent enzyme [Planctomycetales bacterium]NIN77100.1 aminotransferase class V-fold PLP-dependent enzyme [Planctomycetales bacterium]NIO34280.1 aminotransferase class V-fold PLP-dependent enzyme [Planctomycetales bacterium]
MRNTRDTQLLFELSKAGRRAVELPACDVPQEPIADLIPARLLATCDLPLPELTEPQLVRHYANLSTLNMSVDTHFYPLGSCTMKYNPKRNERLAALPGIVDLHPYQPDESLQGLLALLYGLQEMLSEIAGLDAVSLQPAAGAHGELTALMVAAAYFREQGERRTKILTPDSAHGTNPASASMCGFDAVTVNSTSAGFVDLEDLKQKLDDQVAVFMITNPNTLGLFDPYVRQIADLVHERGGLIYLDGANMNAILGVTRPGDFGTDMMHYNPHKTFSGPHGGGGPGAGPIAVTAQLEPYLPSPTIVKKGNGADACYQLDYDRPRSIGRVRSFFGNTGVLVRAYCYIMTHGPDGLRRVAENAVLNANYLLSRLQPLLPVPHGPRCAHEFVATALTLKQQRGVTAMDVVKRLLDFGYHAPTVYFPLTVKEAIMVEPTETESKETLDAFAETLRQIVDEPPETLHAAPLMTPVSRPDEVAAARKPVLRWREAEQPSQVEG